MNILAHLYLSGGINELMLGNFMGDFVKGNQYLNYPPAIQQGIVLHRKIDDFTDKHELHKLSRDRFRSKYGLHSGIVVDIVYDHFLAKNWNQYHPLELEAYSVDVYKYITQNEHWLPTGLKEITPYIIKNNWLVQYKSLPGLEKVLLGMAKRTSLPEHVSYALDVVDKEQVALFNEFNELFGSLIKMVNSKQNGNTLEQN